MERRLAAVLMADVVGYSRLMEEDEPATLAALKERQSSIVEPTVWAHGGRIVKVMGDGVLVEFPSAVNAVAGALEVQRQMAEANAPLPDTRRIALRIGINLGDVMVDGADIYGEGVNIAARLEALAVPGGTCISAKVYEEVRGKTGFSFEDMGEQILKNITRPIHAYRLRAATSADDAPPGVRMALNLPDKPSLAVLPFQNMSGDSEQEYFADGMVEEIITALSRIRRLFVIARNSSFAYKGSAVDVKQVGRELGVRYVLEGSVRKAGNRMRITGQLIDAGTGVHLWADRFEGKIEDVFDLQDQVTASVVGAIGPKLEQAEIERIKRKPTQNQDAYDYYLRGMSAFHRNTREGHEESLRLFYRAIELDPDFAPAIAMAAHGQRVGFGWVGDDRARETAEAERLARRAAEAGKDDAVALSMAGMALMVVVGDLDDGAALIGRALELNPNLASAWIFGAWAKLLAGEPESAIEYSGRAMRLSPQDPQVFTMQTATAFAHFFAGRPEEAFSWAEKAVRMQSNFYIALCIAAASGALAGKPAEAEKAMTRLRQINPELRVSNLKNILPIQRPEDLARLAEGMRKAGLPE